MARVAPPTKRHRHRLCLFVSKLFEGIRTPKGRTPLRKSQRLGFFRRTPRRKALCTATENPLCSTTKRTVRHRRAVLFVTKLLIQDPENLREQILSQDSRTQAGKKTTNCESRVLNPLCSTKAESDELLLLADRVCGKSENLRMQKFCRPHPGAANFFSGNSFLT